MLEVIEKGLGSFSKDTELLTPKGWINITEVTKETLVAQYTIDGFITFANPILLKTTWTPKAIRLYSKVGNFDQLVGCYHTIPYIYTTDKRNKVQTTKTVIGRV